MSKGHIIASGGGMDLTLIMYALKLSGKEHPRTCFLPTASGDMYSEKTAKNSIFGACGPISIIRLLYDNPTKEELERKVRRSHIFYVPGGNTRNMMILWKAYGLDLMLEEAWHNGAIFIGSSAGCLCWFRCGLSDSWGPGYNETWELLGLLPFSNTPHYDKDGYRGKLFHEKIAQQDLVPGYGIPDGAAIHFHGTEVVNGLLFEGEDLPHRVERGMINPLRTLRLSTEEAIRDLENYCPQIKENA